MGRKQFNKEYKIAAINLVKEKKLKLSEAARQLTLFEGTLYRWIQEYEEFGDQAFPDKRTAIYHQLYKQKVLEKENLALKEEIDLFSRKVVGWSMNKRRKDLAIDVFLQAYGKEKPPKGLLVHTDQGSQYTGVTFRNIVENNAGHISNSGKGNPYDNAIMESFYRTLKRELINDAHYIHR